MTKTKVEHVSGELVGDGKSYKVDLKLTVKELHVDERSEPVTRIIEKHELVPTPGLVIEDGKYILQYSFSGKQEKHSVRVQSGMLLAGG